MDYAEIISTLIVSLTVGLTAGFMISFLVAPIFCILRLFIYVPFVNNRIYKKAVNDGHIINATLVSSRRVTRINRVRDDDFVREYKNQYIYEYDCNGKKRTYLLESKYRQPQTIALYYIKNPKKACIPSEIGFSEKYWVKFYFIISLIISVIFTIGTMIFSSMAV